MDYEEVQLAGDGELFIKSPYVAWKSEDTRVINYILGRTNPNVPGDTGITPPMAKLLDRGWRLSANTRTARAEVKREFGQILEENAAGDYVFFRVYKERK
jgi:hypothetical protein